MNSERWAWGEFWSEQDAVGMACLHYAPTSLRSALSHHWHASASHFAVHGRIIDLGCGNGIVGRQLTQARIDLRVDGVDFATDFAPSSDDRLTIWPGVPIETLPFENGTFNGAVSQFGFEYCKLDEGITELARVLAPGAFVSFIVHHGQGPIAQDNILSEEALRHLLSPTMERAFVDGRAEDVARLTNRIGPLHRRDATVDMLANTLGERVKLERTLRRQCWSAIRDALQPELLLLAALKRSAVGPSAIEQWVRPFATEFCDLTAEEFLVDDQPFAWRIFARRASDPR